MSDENMSDENMSDENMSDENMSDENMSDEIFEVTKDRQLAVTFSYLCYSGETLTEPLNGDANVPQSILRIMDCAMPQLPILRDASGKLDWRVVWGPSTFTFDIAILQDNMMYVAQSISDPTQYFVAIRGTNGSAIWDWIEEDFQVLHRENWEVPEGRTAEGNPQISRATNIGLDALLNSMTPPAGLAGEGQDITTFLKSIAQNGPVSITVTGHSLAGALCEALGLWFRQSSGLAGSWDPDGNAAVKVISFAGATTGTTDFAAYYNEIFSGNSTRIHNYHDIVPHAWERDKLEGLPDIYAHAGVEMPGPMRLVLDYILAVVEGYKQVETSARFTFPLDPAQNTYLKKVGYQHVESYPGALQVANPRPIQDACEAAMKPSSKGCLGFLKGLF